MNIRAATRADLAAIHLVEVAAMGVDAWSPPQVAEELDRPGGLFLVAEGAEGVIGLAMGWVVLGDLHVLQIAVAPMGRRRGYGRSLLAALEREARHAEAAFLEVRTDNEPAIALYLGAGFSVIGRRPHYYADGCDALVLRRSLPVQ